MNEIIMQWWRNWGAKEALGGWSWIGKGNSNRFTIGFIKLCYNCGMNDVNNYLEMVDVILHNGDEFLTN
jgi:hypothetical protein